MTWWRDIRAVTFDVGGTLIEPRPSVGHIYAAVAAEAGMPDLDPALLNDRFNAAWRTKTRFDYSREAWAELVKRTVCCSPDQCDVVGAFFTRLYAEFGRAGAWKVHDDVRPALEALRGRGIKLAVVSNWDERLRPLLSSLELDVWFESIQVSGEIGFHKPEPRIFLRAANALGVEPSAILHVGDSRVEDLQGATDAGLRAVLIERAQEHRGPGEIGSLMELPVLLRKRSNDDDPS